MHAWMDGCAFTRSALTQILNMVLQTFSQHRLRYRRPTTSLRHLDSDKHQRKCFQNDSGAAFVFSTSRVPEPISAPFLFCLRGCRRAEINGRVAGNLITRHYEAEMLS